MTFKMFWLMSVLANLGLSAPESVWVVVALDAETYEPVRYSKFFTFENQKVEYSLGMTLETCVFDFDRPVTKEYLMFGYSLMDNVSKTCVIPVEQFKKDFISLRWVWFFLGVWEYSVAHLLIFGFWFSEMGLRNGLSKIETKSEKQFKKLTI